MEEKSVDKMFEKFGYKINEEAKEYDEDVLICYECKDGFIIFFKDKFFTLVAREEDCVFAIDKEELTLINKKIEELGW